MLPLTAPSGQRPTEFRYFPLLPAEIRAKILHEAIPRRIVSIKYNPDSDTVSSSTRIPSVLQTNAESRGEVSRDCSRHFSTKTSEAKVYFDPARDTLYFPRCREMGYDETLRDFRNYLAKPEECDEVRRVALEIVDERIKRPWESYDKCTLIKSLPNLETVYLVLQPKKQWLTNVPIMAPPTNMAAQVKSRGDVEFVQYPDRQEAERARRGFAGMFDFEEMQLKRCREMDGESYEVRKCPKLVVVAKKGEFVRQV
jgi:hypothetical protein